MPFYSQSFQNVRVPTLTGPSLYDNVAEVKYSVFQWPLHNYIGLNVDTPFHILAKVTLIPL